MKWLVLILATAFASAIAAEHWLHLPLVVFVASGAALILLSYFLGEATEQLSTYVGDRAAGLMNVTLSNLAELIIIFAAVRAGLVSVVQAGIVGSIMGNLLLVMGLAIVFGCKKNGTLKHNPDVATLLINQLFLVGTVLMLPTMFNGHIPDHRQFHFSGWLAVILFGTYVYYYILSFRDPRFKDIQDQSQQVHRHWSLPLALVVLGACGLGAFWMSEMLVRTIEPVTKLMNWSPAFVGFVVFPLLGNVAEHQVAITAARRNHPELSLAISVGSASQVGMVVAPCAVLFGWLLGQPISLYFASLPLGTLLVSVIAGYLVLRDDKWNINEGVMLLAIYAAMVLAFWFVS